MQIAPYITAMHDCINYSNTAPQTHGRSTTLLDARERHRTRQAGRHLEVHLAADAIPLAENKLIHKQTHVERTPRT